MSSINNGYIKMEMDNEEFVKHNEETIKEIDKLKKNLDFNKTVKNVSILQTAINSIGFISLNKSINTVSDTIESVFDRSTSRVRQFADNIIAQVTGMVQKVNRELFVEPKSTGFQEYETQIGAVQTILANTSSAGTTLDEVMDALNELNKYADQTIYNFTEMTRNIGTFTAAGVDLDTSVKAIQGIANLAAISGSSSQQASTAMYQLSQALAAGRVGLQDWNSVVNAGMGGKVFQDALVQTAEEMGVIVDLSNGFRQSISAEGGGQSWLTADILLATLNKFADTNTELGKLGVSAATEVKTISQLWDTLKETMQSTWTSTWEYIIGDFDDAKQLMTKISTTVSDILQPMGDSRNNLLKYWAEVKLVDDDTKQAVKDAAATQKEIDEVAMDVIRGDYKNAPERFDLLRQAGYDPKVIQDRVDEILGITRLGTKEVSGALAEGMTGREYVLAGLGNIFEDLIAIIKAFGSAFSKVFAGVNGEKLSEMSVKFYNFTESMRLSDTTLKNLKDTFVYALSGVSNIISGITTSLKAVATAFAQTFLGGKGDEAKTIKKIAKAFYDFTEKLKGSDELFEKVATISRTVFSIIGLGLKVVKGFGIVLGDLFKSFMKTDSGKGLSETFLTVSDGVFALNKAITAQDIADIITTKFIEPFKKFGGSIDSVKDIFTKAKDFITDSIGKIVEKIKTFYETAKDNNSTSWKDRLAGIGDAFAHIKDVVLNFFASFADSKELKVGVTIIGICSAVAAGVFILIGAVKAFSKLFKKKTEENPFAELIGSITGVVEDFGGTLEAINKNLQAGAVLKLAVALLALAAAVSIIAKLKVDEIVKGLIGVGILFAMIQGLSNSIAGAAFFVVPFILIDLAVCFLALAGALKILATMNFEQAFIAIGSMSAVLALLAPLFDSIAFVASQAHTGKQMLALSLLVSTLSGVVVAIAGSLAVLSLFNPDKLSAAATNMLEVILAMAIMFNQLGQALDTNASGKKLLAFAAIISILGMVIDGLTLTMAAMTTSVALIPGGEGAAALVFGIVAAIFGMMAGLMAFIAKVKPPSGNDLKKWLTIIVALSGVVVAIIAALAVLTAVSIPKDLIGKPVVAAINANSLAKDSGDGDGLIGLIIAIGSLIVTLAAVIAVVNKSGPLDVTTVEALVDGIEGLVKAVIPMLATIVAIAWIAPDPELLGVAIGAMTKSLILLVLALAAISELNPPESNIVNIIDAMSLAIIAIGGALSVILLVSKLNPDGMGTAVVGLLGSLGIMLLMVYALQELAKAQVNPTTAIACLDALADVMIKLSIALGIVNFTAKDNKDPSQTIWNAVSLIGMLAALAFAMNYLSSIRMPTSTILMSLDTMCVIMIELAVALAIITYSLGNNEHPIMSAITGTIAIIALLAAFVVALNFIAKVPRMQAVNDSLISIGVTVLLLGLTLSNLMKAIGEAGGDWTQIIAAGGAVAALVLALGTAMLIMSKMNTSGIPTVTTSFLMIAAAVWLLVPALVALTYLDTDEILKAALAISLVLTALGFVAGAAAKSGGGGGAAGGGATIAIIGTIIALVAAIALLVFALSSLINAIIALSEADLNGISAQMSLMCDALVENSDKIGEAIASIIAGFIENMAEKAPAMFENLTTMIQLFGEFLRTWVPYIIESVTEMLVQGIMKILDVFIFWMPEIIDRLVQLILAIVNGVADALINRREEIADAIINLILAVLIALGTLVQKIASGLWDFLKKIWNMVSDWWAENKDKIGPAIIKGIKGAWKKCLELNNWIGEQLGKAGKWIIDKIKEKLGIQPGSHTFKDIAGDILEHMKQGFIDNVHKVIDGARTVVNKIKDFFSGMFDINSPSGVTEEYGKYLDEGFSVGMEKNVGGVTDSIESVTGDMTDSFDDGLEDIPDKGTEVSEELSDNLTSGISDASIGDVFGDIFSDIDLGQMTKDVGLTDTFKNMDLGGAMKDSFGDFNLQDSLQGATEGMDISSIIPSGEGSFDLTSMINTDGAESMDMSSMFPGLGEGLDLGGMTDSVGLENANFTDAMSNMGENGMGGLLSQLNDTSGVESAMSNITGVIGEDREVQTHITPVYDMSSMEELEDPDNYVQAGDINLTGQLTESIANSSISDDIANAAYKDDELLRTLGETNDSLSTLSSHMETIEGSVSSMESDVYAIKDSSEYTANNVGQDVYIDSNTLVGSIGPKMNDYLGTASYRQGRNTGNMAKAVRQARGIYGPYE